MKGSAVVFLAAAAAIVAMPLSAKPKDGGGEDKARSVQKVQKAEGAKEKSAQRSDDRPLKAAVFSKGLVHMEARANTGVLKLHAIRADGSRVPVISDYDDFSGSYFLLKAGRTVYKLNVFGGFYPKVKNIDGGIQIDCPAPNVADVEQTFVAMKSSEGAADVDLIRAEIKVTNKKSRSETFALKAVFDTSLEERAGGVISTARVPSVRGDRQFFSMEDDKWIRTSCNDAAVEFVTAGADTSPVDAATVTNSEIASLPLWTPVVSSARSFSTALTYDNSALAFNWRPVKMAQGESASFVFYIALGADGGEPQGEAFLENFGSEPSAPKIESEPEAEEAKPDGPDVPFVVAEKDRLDLLYIQRLIDRINALEDDGSNTNREELLDLNGELDAILGDLESR